MKATIRLIRIDNDPSLGEPEVVFEVIPNIGDGVYTKNRWLGRVAYSFVSPRANFSPEQEDIATMKEILEAVKANIKLVMNIEHDN